MCEAMVCVCVCVAGWCMVQWGGSLAAGTNREGADGGWGSGTWEIRRDPIKMKSLPLRLVCVNPVYCVAMLSLKNIEWKNAGGNLSCVCFCELLWYCK